MELRCPSGKLFGIMVDGLVEVRCRSKRCGYLPGIVILHRINPETGETVQTFKYRNSPSREVPASDSRDSGSAVWHESSQAHASGIGRKHSGNGSESADREASQLV